MNHLERALDHQNQWWKYLVIFLSGFLAANFIGAIPLMIVIFIKISQNGGVIPNPENYADLTVYGISQNLGLFLMIIPFVVGLITVILLLKPLHKRNFKEVINGTQKIRWKRFFTSFLIWGSLSVLYLAISYQANPRNFQFHFDPNTFIVLFIIVVTLIPFQTTYEELVFRGYLPQGFAAWTRNRYVVLIVPALIFGLMHAFNPEVKEFGFWIAMPQYWLFGLCFGLITVLDDGIELSMGAHAANNIFSALLVTQSSSVLQTPALFTQIKVDAVQDTYILGLMSVLLIFILSKLYKWDFSVLNNRVRREAGN